MKDGFLILSCLTKSNDKLQDQNEIVHLIASTVLIQDHSEIPGFIEILKQQTFKKKTIIFIISEFEDKIASLNSYNYLNKEINSNSPNKKDSKYLDHGIHFLKEENFISTIELDFDHLLSLISNNEGFNYFCNLFNSDDSQTKLYTQCLFIFKNIS